MKTTPSTNPVDDYARDVVEGRVPAGKYHRLACARHLKDREREGTPGFPYQFVWEKRKKNGKLSRACALHFITFARKMKHYKGRQFAGKPFEPTPVQVFRLGCIFGWRQVATGYRRFTTAYNELPRKHGKSFEEAVVAVYCTFFEGESGAEGYCIATKEKQAQIASNAARRLVKASGLSARITVNAKNLYREKTECKLEPLGSDSDTTDGLNPHFIGVDELHAFKHRNLLDVMESALGARVNPMMFQITTAGNNLVSPCGDQHDYACRILDGVLDDDASTLAFFAFIAHADEGDDWQAEETWRKACPHWGISVNPDEIRKMAAKAAQMSSAANEFKQKILNIWVGTAATCLSVDGWRKGQSPVIVTRESTAGEAWRLRCVEELRHEPCYIGLDLASKIDLAALVCVFPPRAGRRQTRWLAFALTPEDTLDARAHRDRAPYRVWKEAGWLYTCPGKQIRRSWFLERIAELRDVFDIELLGYDPWHADQIVEDLTSSEYGFKEDQIIGVPQTFAGMSSACLRVQADILESDIDAGGSPLVAWSVANTVGQGDGKDNLMFAKGRSKTGRIDPVIAGTIGTANWLRVPPEPENIYLTRGVKTLGQ